MLLVTICIVIFLAAFAMVTSIGTDTVYLPAVVACLDLPAHKRLNLYYQTSQNPIYGTWKFDDWQVGDMRWVARREFLEVMLLRNRGGSKTRDGSVLAVWFAYQRNANWDEHAEAEGRPIDNGNLNRVIWYAASDSQLKQARTYFMQNRYVNARASSSYDIYLWNGNRIQLRMMSKNQAASPRADIVFYDEEQDMKPEIYGLSIGTLVGGDGRKIHMGTTELDTILEDNFVRLREEDRVLEHHIEECSWTTLEKALANYAGMPQFVIDSQLFCRWVRPGGTVFTNVEEGYMFIHPNYPRYYGIDPNPKSGHAMVCVRWQPEESTIYVEEEFAPYTDSFAFAKDLIPYIYRHNTFVEIEENAGEEFLKILEKEMDAQPEALKDQGSLEVMRWNEQNKHDRIFSIRKFQILVNPACKETLKMIREAVWNPKEPKARLLKSPTQHYLDAFIHACAWEGAAEITSYS